MLLSDPMNLLDLTITQLKRAAEIKQQIEDLNKELGSVLSGSTKLGVAPSKTRSMSASVRKKIAATQKARWAKRQGAKAATPLAKPATKAKKKSMSPAARAKLSAKLKAFWAAKKSGKK
jgi:hypothetical protein